MRNHSSEAGFTLIELLVVVTVIGIIVSIAILSLGVLGDDRQLRVEARRVSTLLAAAQDEAVMQGREFGLEISTQAYRFVEFDPFQERWLELQTDDIFRSRQLPDNQEFELFLEDKRVSLAGELSKLAAEDIPGLNSTARKYAPQIMIFSSGETTPFELHLLRPAQQQSIVLQGDVLGGIEIMTASELADARR